MMNRNEVLKLAKECGITFTPAGPGDDGVDAWYGNQYLPNGSLERFAAAMYAAGAEDMRERADDAWADAIQADCEHGVKFLSEKAASELHRLYPELAKLGATICALPITTNTEGAETI